MKICCHCKEELPLEFFQKNRSTPDGLQYQCKNCTKKSNRICRANRGHLWIKNNNPWSCRPENRKRINDATRARRAKNSHKIQEENRRYRLLNPFVVATASARGRAKRLGIFSTLTAQEWQEVVEREKFICHLCGEKVSFEVNSPDRISLDHIVPMSRDGKNVKENVLPAHRLCNQNRSNMMLEEFDIWVNKIYLSRRSGYGESKESQFISQPPPPLTAAASTVH